MGGRSWAGLMAGIALWASCAPADAAACGAGAPSPLAARIAAIACDEHRLWHAPFIDLQGRLAHIRVSEGENARLADGESRAWQRVVHYWRGSGLRWPPRYDGAEDCDAPVDRRGAASCRAFLIDTPWSAVFVSYVMTRAGVPGFEPSARHVDYVRAAYRSTDGVYRFADPDAELPGVGDLLCFSRVPGTVFGHDGIRRWLEQSGGQALAMHCDVVVAATGGTARLVGGNVVQGVTMRTLALNRAGRLWSLPRRTTADAPCTPDNDATCSLNRQDWVALLKLDPRAVGVEPTPVPAGSTPTAPTRECCTVCMLPMPEGMARCPAPSPGEGTD